MRRRIPRNVILSEAKDLLFILPLAIASACAENASPVRRLPASLDVVASPVASATVGTNAGTLSVRVRDAADQPLPGVVVTFAASLGGGRPSATADTTGTDGIASADLLIGTAPGQNQLSARVPGVTPVTSVTVSASAGPVARIVTSTSHLRFSAARTAAGINAQARDVFGNATAPTVIWQSRNPALVTLTQGGGNNAVVTVASRPGQAYLVASAGAVTDSILVSVLDASSSPCAFSAAARTLAIGETAAFDSTGVLCVRADAAGAEYAVVTHYAAAPASALVNVELTGAGVTAPSTAWPAVAGDVAAAVASLEQTGRPAFETSLRQRERIELADRAAGARAWYQGRAAAGLVAALREGDHMSVNVNASDFCIRPDLRPMRVAAISNTAVILADSENPPDGFTDEEYRAFGAAMDTLVYPVDTAAFGVPTDIDGNGRVVIAFTRAVNELTPRGSAGGIALGFFFSRDLLPRQSASGLCAGSNVAEMFYVLVPDPAGVVGDARSKAFVQSVAVSIIAHEFQHLINTSRRLYINRSAAATEELWLNEGLSHLAEELIFYRASGLSPRQNIGAAQLAPGSATRAHFDTYVRGNFGRYLSYLRSPELNSPISPDDLLATRGATWAFLRFVADRAGPTDGTFWRRLANSPRTGLINLDAELAGTGLTALGLMRDWSVSILTDDVVPGGGAPAQPSWDFVSGMPAVGLAFGLVPAPLVNEITFLLAIRAGGSSYARFAVPENREALLQVRGTSGTALPAGVRLTAVRTR